MLSSTAFYDRVLDRVNGQLPFKLDMDALASLYEDRKFPLKEENLKKYDAKELDRLADDAVNIIKATFHKATPQDKPYYIASAGAPCVGKSTQLELTQLLKGEDWPVYVSPDRGVIQGVNALSIRSTEPYVPGAPLRKTGLETTYWAQYDECKDHAQCYDKWREASIWINELIFLLAAAHKCNIVHDTTHTSPGSIYSFKFLNKCGYHITVNMMTASQSAREAARDSRAVVQVTAEDFRDKVITPAQVKMFVEQSHVVALMFNDEKFIQANGAECWKVLAVRADGEAKLLVSKDDLPEGTIMLAAALQQEPAEKKDEKATAKEVGRSALMASTMGGFSSEEDDDDANVDLSASTSGFGSTGNVK